MLKDNKAHRVCGLGSHGGAVVMEIRATSVINNPLILTTVPCQHILSLNG